MNVSLCSPKRADISIDIRSIPVADPDFLNWMELFRQIRPSGQVINDYY